MTARRSLPTIAIATCAVATIAASIGCSTPTRGPVFPPPLVANNAATVVTPERAAQIIALGRAYEVATGNISAQVSVALRDIGHNQAFNTTGGIAVRRPDAMRMQMAGPGGVTAIDLLALDGAYWFRVAGREWERGSLSDEPREGFPASTVARVFLGFDWDHANVVRDGALAVVRVPSPGGYALVSLEPRDGAAREVRWFRGGDVERARVRFAEFQVENGARFPRVVLFWQSTPDEAATITVERRTLSPTLPTQTFTAPEMPAATTTP